MSELRTVLATREVPTLLTTSLVGRLPTAMANLAVLLLVRGQGGDYTLAGTLAALFIAGSAIGQPTLARIVDRRGQPAVLLGSAAISTAAFVVLGLAGAHHPLLAGVAAALAGLGTPPLEPCLRSLWPHVVPAGAVLRAAFSLDVGVQEVVFVAGPLLSVAAVTALGHGGAVFGCALFGAAGTLTFAITRAARGWRPTPHHTGPHGSPLRHPGLRRVFAVALAGGVPVGALAIAAATFASRHGDSSITGWALAANAAGALVAGLWGAVRPIAEPTGRLLTLATLALAVGYLPLAVPLPVPAWIALAALAGAPLPVLLTLAFQLVQVRSPANLMTEANAWVVTAFGMGAAVAALLAGVVSDRLSSDAAVATIALASAAVAALVAALAHRGSRT